MFRNALKIINPSLITKHIKSNTNNVYLMKLSTSTVMKDKIYTDSGEWILKVNDSYNIGLTEKSVSELGELVYLEFDTDITETVENGEDLAIIESVKASASIIAPFDCEIVSHNNELIDALETINENPECEDYSWIVKVRKV
jgi:glycine cleavage system H protein